MQGDGTQANPYIPNTWDDFVTAIGTSGAYVELPIELIKTSDEKVKNGKLYFDSQGNRIATPIQSELSSYYENDFKFDMNTVNPLGVFISFNNCHVDGNGASVVNLYISDNNSGILISSGTVYINNINFLNIYCDRSNTNYGILHCANSNGGYELQNVQFQGYVNRGTVLDVTGSVEKFTSVTFSFTFGINACFANGVFNSDSKLFNFVLFDFYGNPTSLFKSNYGNRFVNCKMTGKLTGTSGTNYTFPSDTSSSNCVIDMDVTNYNGVSFDYYNGSDPYIINTDKIPVGTVHDNILGVTTLQLQDASYLRSVGFPVGD